MKILTATLILPILAFLAPLAEASTYTGMWNNTTFGSSGDLTVDFEIDGNSANGFIDADGLVFGVGDPPPIEFSATLQEDGSGSFNVTGTPMGDISGSVDVNGKLDVKITNIPGGFLTEARFNGQFDLDLGKFEMTYEIDSTFGLFAEGNAEAHVPTKPTLKVSKNVKYEGKTGKTKATVKTNTGVKSFTAKAKGAKVRVKGSGPYKIIVKKAKKKVTRVKVTVINDDDLKTSKFVKFRKK